MLRLEGVEQYYGQSHTLWNVDLQVPEGKCLCVMGRNGMGKTTLLKSIMGLLPVSDGQIEFQGHVFAARGKSRHVDTAERVRAGIGYVPQGRMIFAGLTVEENLRTGLLSRKGTKRVPDMVYELFPVLADMRRRRGGDLSGGQQQQLAIGRALCLNPNMLILDEPTEGIQPNIVQEIGDIMIRLNKQGLTILLVEQKLRFARKVAHRFAIMDKGRIPAHGDMDSLSEDLVRKHLTV